MVVGNLGLVIVESRPGNDIETLKNLSENARRSVSRCTVGFTK